MSGSAPQEAKGIYTWIADSRAGHDMDPIRRNYFLDAFMGVIFAACLLTGLVFFPGLLEALGVKFSAIPVQLLRTVHEWTGLIVGLFVIIHIALHWQWVANVTRSVFGRKTDAKKGENA